MTDRFLTSLGSHRWGVLELRILAGIGLTLFGAPEVFPGPFARIDLRFHRWLSRRVPALYAIPGMPHRYGPARPGAIPGPAIVHVGRHHSAAMARSQFTLPPDPSITVHLRRCAHVYALGLLVADLTLLAAGQTSTYLGLVETSGLEPPTPCLQSRCSTN
jgi:hypothetical protein